MRSNILLLHCSQHRISKHATKQNVNFNGEWSCLKCTQNTGIHTLESGQRWILLTLVNSGNVSIERLHGKTAARDRPTSKTVQFCRHLVPKRAPNTKVKFNGWIAMLQIQEDQLRPKISNHCVYWTSLRATTPLPDNCQHSISERTTTTKMNFNGRISKFRIHNTQNKFCNIKSILLLWPA